MPADTDMIGDIFMDAKELAGKLLDAQVEFIIGEVSGDRLTEVVARDIDDLLAAAAQVTVAELVDPSDVKATARQIVDKPGASAVVRQLVVGLGAATYEHAANEEHHLGDIIAREQVERIVHKVLTMRTLHEEVLRRLSDSPMVATVASWFVGKLVSDVMAQNRARAEKVPGMSSLLSLGDRAAKQVRTAGARHIDEFVGDLAGKGAQAAMRRVNAAIRHTMAEAPLKGAAMEVWDMHADDKISGLKDYLSQDDLAELSEIGYDIWLGMRGTEYFGELLDSGIDVFFETYGAHPIPDLLAELNVSRDDLVTEVQRYAPSVVEALKKDGKLDALIRARLEPFFYSDTVLGLLES